MLGRVVRVAWVAIVGMAMTSSAAASDCVVTSADPATYHTVVVPSLPVSWIGEGTYYVEDRGTPVGAPVPGTSILFGPDADGDGVPEPLKGDGTWIYREGNGLPGLQRGCFGFLCGSWLPAGCTNNPDWEPTDGQVPCLLSIHDWASDETCGAGFDEPVIGVQLFYRS